MEVDKENWLPMPTKKQQLARRRSTGIMKGGDSTGTLISPKAKKRSRLEMMNKRVSFGVVDVRLYEKDTDWTASPAEKKASRSVDVGSVPFNDHSSPMVPPAVPDKSMLRSLVDDDDDDDDDEQTMEMTVNHGRIISEALNGNTNLSTLVADDESECPASPLTMDLTVNYSKIMHNKQEEDETMDMTVNYSKIVSPQPVIINVITSPKSDESSQNITATSNSPATPNDRPVQRLLTSPPSEEGISFSISTPPEALKPSSAELDQFELLSPSRRSFIDHDQTTDLTRNIQHHIGTIVAGGDDGDKTVDLSRLASQMTEHEAKVAMEFKRILNSEVDADVTTNITVQLDNVDDFLSNIRSPEISSKEASKEPPKVEPSPIRLPAINSIEGFLSHVQVRFMDSSSSCKSRSIGYVPSREPPSEKERLQLACIQLPNLQNLQQSMSETESTCNKLSSEIKEMEDWLNSQAPQIFTKFLQMGDDRLYEVMQRLKQACKLQSKIKWCEHRQQSTESLLISLNDRTRQLKLDNKTILEADSQIKQMMHEQKAIDDKLGILRTAIEGQAFKIDELNNDLEYLRKTKSSLTQNLEHLELAVKKQESLASKKESWRRDEVSLVERSRELYFLQACFDWRLTKCSESDLILSFGSLCFLAFHISGNGTGDILSAKFVRQKSGSEIWAALVKANEPYINTTLQQTSSVAQLPHLLNKLSLRLGRMRSLEMEIQRIMASYTILVEPSPNDFLLNITVCSPSPMSSVTFTVRLDVGLLSTKPVSLVEVRLMLGPEKFEEDIREIIASTSGFGSLTKICSAILAKL